MVLRWLVQVCSLPPLFTVMARPTLGRAGLVKSTCTLYVSTEPGKHDDGRGETSISVNNEC